MPHKQASVAQSAAAAARAQRKKEEKEAAKLRRANESYRTLLEEPTGNVDVNADDEERRLRKKEKKLRKKQKQDLENLWASDEEVEIKTTAIKNRKRKKGRW